MESEDKLLWFVALWLALSGANAQLGALRMPVFIDSSNAAGKPTVTFGKSTEQHSHQFKASMSRGCLLWKSLEKKTCKT